MEHKHVAARLLCLLLEAREERQQAQLVCVEALCLAALALFGVLSGRGPDEYLDRRLLLAETTAFWRLSRLIAATNAWQQSATDQPRSSKAQHLDAIAAPARVQPKKN